MVEPPNELELSRAFTRKMNHLIYVIKAIRKFKTILDGHRAAALGRDPATTPAAIPDLDAAKETAQAEHIEALIAQRLDMLAQEGDDNDEESSNKNKGHAHDVSDQDTLFLGIGTGARDDFSVDEATPDVVADSPTAVDFNVYDRAYEEAVQSHIKANPASHPTLYLTNLVKETEHFKKLESLVQQSGAAAIALMSPIKESTQQLEQHLPSSTDTGLAQLAAKMGISGGTKHKE